MGFSRRKRTNRQINGSTMIVPGSDPNLSLGGFKDFNNNITKARFTGQPPQPEVEQPKINPFGPLPTPSASYVPPSPTPTPTITSSVTPTLTQTPTPSITPSSTPPPSTYLLDDYPGANFAYSVRQLSSTYLGSSLRVRRSSDNTEQDIGFINGTLDTSSLLSFVGGGNGFVTTFYDQSGNLNDLTQITSSLQPLIVSGGSLITDNGRPAILWDGSNDRLQVDVSYSVTSQSNFVVFNMYSGSSIYSRIVTQSSNFNDNNGAYIQILRDALTENVASYIDNSIVASVSVNYNTQMLFASIHTGSQVQNSKNGTSANTYSDILNTSFEQFSIGNSTDTTSGNNALYGTIQEVVVYNSDESSNQSGIQSNINDYFIIYLI